MKMNDNLYTRGSNVFTSLLSIPPNYIYGDRYQFDCPIVVNLVSDANATLIGVDLVTDCHNLVFKRLEMPKMSHKVFLGQRAKEKCLPLGVYNEKYPIVMLSEYVEETQTLGNFITISKVRPGPQAVTLINPSTGDYQATFNDITVMILGTIFNSSMSVSKNGLNISSRLKIFNLYNCSLQISASLNRPWKDTSYTVEGVFAKIQRKGFVEKLTESTFLYLKRLTKQGVTKKDLVAMELQKSRELSSKLQDTVDALVAKRTDLASQYQDTLQDIQEYSILITELNRNLSLLGTQSSRLINNLNAICFLMDCPRECQKGLVPSDCSYQEKVDRWGNCADQCERQRTENALSGTRRVSCSSWQYSNSRWDICGCWPFFTCSCSFLYVPRYCCCPSVCEQNIYRQVTVTYLVPCTRSCIVGQDVRNVQRTCQIESDCASLEQDQACVAQNALCRAQRSEALKNLQDESSQILRDLEASKKAKAAADVRLISLQFQLDDITKQINEYSKNLDNLNTNSLEKELENVETENKHLLELAKSLDDPDSLPFQITSVEFELVVVKGSPKRFPLKVTFEIPSKSGKDTVTVPFDFGNEAASFYQSSQTIGASILNEYTGASSRKRRQIGDNTEKTTKEHLEEQCATVGNIATFFTSLQQSLASLNTTESQERATASSLAAELEVQTSTQAKINETEINVEGLAAFNVSTSSEDLRRMAEEDKELLAIIDLKQSLITRLQAAANGSAVQNMFLIWKMELNRVLNMSEESFGYSCSSMADCFTVAINVVEGILQSVPDPVVADFKRRLEEAESDLEELSTSVNLTLSSATSLLLQTNTLLADMIDLNYWCALPPNISHSSNSNITVVENARVELNCTAKSDFEISYQWEKDEVVLPMQVKSTLVIDRVKQGDTGFYTCHASNHIGTTSSPWAYVEVQQVPVFYQEPSDESRVVGEARAIALNCNATSRPDPQFRWYYRPDAKADYHLLVNRTGSILLIESPTEGDAGWYRCEAWNSVASAFSRSARVSILRYTTAVMGFPLEYELTSCDGSNFTSSQVESVLQSTTSSIMDGSKISQVITSFEDNVTTASFILLEKNTTRPDLFPESLQSISGRIVPSRRKLMSIKERLDQILLQTSTYTDNGLNVCNVVSTSEDKLIFQCGYGQQLDTDNNMLCSEYYESCNTFCF